MIDVSQYVGRLDVEDVLISASLHSMVDPEGDLNQDRNQQDDPSTGKGDPVQPAKGSSGVPVGD